MNRFISIFPPGLVITQRFSNASMYLEQSYAWDIDRYRIGKGEFSVSIDGIHTRHIQLGFTSRSTSINSRGAVPKETIMFAILTNDAPSAVHKYVPMGKHHVLCVEDSSEFNLITATSIDLLTVVIEKGLFKRHYLQHNFEEFRFPDEGDLFEGSEQIVSEASKSLFDILYAVLQKSDFYFSPENMERVESSILNIMTELIFQCTNIDKVSQSNKIAYRLENIMYQKYNLELTFPQLCKALNISERNGYLSFNRLYQITPKQYMLRLRLGKIYDTLFFADPQNTNIYQVALENGFYHMGHFSASYKSFFNELPSVTLGKGLNTK